MLSRMQVSRCCCLKNGEEDEPVVIQADRIFASEWHDVNFGDNDPIDNGVPVQDTPVQIAKTTPSPTWSDTGIAFDFVDMEAGPYITAFIRFTGGTVVGLPESPDDYEVYVRNVVDYTDPVTDQDPLRADLTAPTQWPQAAAVWGAMPPGTERETVDIASLINQPTTDPGWIVGTSRLQVLIKATTDVAVGDAARHVENLVLTTWELIYTK